MENYNSDYEVRLATLERLGGDMTKTYNSVYDIDIEIKRLIGEMIDGKGYVFNPEDGSIAYMYRQDPDDGGQLLYNTVSGLGAVAEGYANTITGGDYGSHVEGLLNTVTGIIAHAEGYGNTASGQQSHVEGQNSVASGAGSHCEGGASTASGKYSHAEGQHTIASGKFSHTEGWGNTNDEVQASGDASHAEGYKTIAQNTTEHAEGTCNESHKASTTYGNAGNTQHSIGISIDSANRKNAFEIMQNGDVYVYGVGTYDGKTLKASGNNVKTLQDVIADLTASIVSNTSIYNYINPLVYNQGSDPRWLGEANQIYSMAISGSQIGTVYSTTINYDASATTMVRIADMFQLEVYIREDGKLFTSKYGSLCIPMEVNGDWVVFKYYVDGNTRISTGGPKLVAAKLIDNQNNTFTVKLFKKPNTPLNFKGSQPYTWTEETDQTIDITPHLYIVCQTDFNEKDTHGIKKLVKIV